MSAIKKLPETVRGRALGRNDTLPYERDSDDGHGGTLPPPRRGPLVDTSAPTQPEIFGIDRPSRAQRRDPTPPPVEREPLRESRAPRRPTPVRPGAMTLPCRREAPTVPGRRAIAPPPPPGDAAPLTLDVREAGSDAATMRRPAPPALRHHDSLAPETSGRYSLVYKRRRD
ncbi:MAG: hypothetical protein HYV09_01990 [Deltaproteobacteria bacterium]|nr:hypothetical protein [Deltaproteobacteria bacterium]